MKKKLTLMWLAAAALAAALLLGGCGEQPSSAPAAPAAAEGEYTLAQLADTQFYAKQSPDYFYAMTQYLADSAPALKLAYVVHTGDIVQEAVQEAQWQVADAALRTVEAAAPVGVLAGNHDTVNGDDRYAVFSRYFGAERYQDASTYGADHENNRAHYDLVSAGTTDYIFVCLGDEPATCCIDFANAAFAAYPERVGVLCTHQYLDEERDFSSMGEYLQREIVAANPNVYLVLCGHAYGFKAVVSTFDDDGDGQEERGVLQISANFQENANPTGYLTLLTVNEAAGTLRTQVYSPVSGAYEPTSAAEFALPWQ